MESFFKEFEVDKVSLSKINGGQMQEIKTGEGYAYDGGIRYYGSEWCMDFGGGVCQVYVQDSSGVKHYAPTVIGN